MISHIDVVTLYVKDQERMATFFTEKLGFEKRTDAEMGPGRRWLEVAPPGARTVLALLKAADFDRPPDRDYPLTFHCADLKGAGRMLQEAKVPVTDIVAEPWGSYRTATDPEGRSIMLAAPTTRE
jgi:lactoylglutathione lyase